jgi:hypothetical protein
MHPTPLPRRRPQDTTVCEQDQDVLAKLGDRSGPVDARLGPDADWLSGPHRSNLEQARLDSSERVTTHRG